MVSRREWLLLAVVHGQHGFDHASAPVGAAAQFGGEDAKPLQLGVAAFAEAAQGCV